ncbi:MAG TPA: lytic transglycosylase domain-containing protein [Mycobacteriales bacterium]|nr:lytic transglycosylase domain-containing protein [Mycobacteriales bacterium]
MVIADTIEPRPPPVQVPTIATRTSSHPAAAAATYFPIAAIPKNLTVRAQQIPRRVLAAYVTAARTIDRAQPSCHLRWYELAGIGFIESGHAHSGGSESKQWNGVAKPPIYGPLLDGSAGVSWHDTDGGRLDHNAQWERAVGPMQFMPTTWAVWGADGNRDRHQDPQQIDDATLAAAGYLCTGGDSGLDQISHLIAAVYSYNHSYAYVRAVLTVASEYAGISSKALGVDKVPPDPGTKPSKKNKPAAAATPSPSPSPSPSPTASLQTSSPHPSSPQTGRTPTSTPSLTTSPTPTSSTSVSATATPAPTDSPSASSATSTDPVPTAS